MSNDDIYRLPVGSYRIETLQKKRYWNRIKSWFHKKNKEEKIMFDAYVREVSEGSLADTMKGIE